MLEKKKYNVFSRKILIIVVFLTIFNIRSSFPQWTLQSNVPGIGIYPSISIYSPEGIVIVGGNTSTAKVYKSTNSGMNWTDITSNLTNTPWLISVWAVDGNTIFVGDGGNYNTSGGNAKVWKTTNGGLNWNNILSTGGTGGYINGIVFSRTTPSFGIIESDPPDGAGQPYWIAKTTDGGDNWLISNPPGISGSTSNDHTVVVIDNLFYGFGIAPGASSYLTSDGGTTWNHQNLSNGGNFTSGLAFSSGKTFGIGLGNPTLPVISRTINGGMNWTSVNTGRDLSGNYPRARWVYGTSTCFVTSENGPSGTIMISSNNGTNWTTQSTSGVTGINDLDLIFNSGIIYAYAISSISGAVIRLEQTVGIEQINTHISNEYKLFQNFPNPFNPATKIKFDIPANLVGQTFLSVFDISGREVAVLVREQLQPGSYDVTFDGSNLPSGVYFYQLQAGDFVQTKKLILLK